MSLNQKNQLPEISPNTAEQSSATNEQGNNQEQRLDAQDYETLLAVSKAIASTRDRDDLFRLIIDRVQPIFGFNQYANIGVYNFQTHALQMFFTKTTEAEQAESEIPKFMQPIPLQGIFQTLIETDEVIILDESWKTCPKTAAIDEASAQIWRDLDFKSALSVRLCSFGKIVGTFHVHFDEAKNFTAEQICLFKAISEQIAVAVANILANEEIIEREREKSQLLAISEQLATIRDKHSLFDVIFNKLQPVFHFDDTAVALYDENLEFTRHLHSGTENDLRGNANYRLIMSEKIPTAGNPHGEFISYKSPCIVTLEYFLEHYPHHVGVQVMKDFGLVECVIMPLRYGGRLLGTFELHSRETGRFSDSEMPLFRNLADQLAVAVSNILANEEILEREREKSQLLGISEQLATIRDKQDLLQVIFDKLKSIFHFDNAVVVLYDETLQYTRHLQTDTLAEQINNSHYQTIMFGKTAVENTVYEEFVRLTEPRIYNLDYFNVHYPEHVGVKILNDFGLVESVLMPLVYGGRLLGTFEFHAKERGRFSEAQMPLFCNLANQIAVAVANILANEEILDREREKAILLKITEQAAKVRDFDELFALVSSEIKPLLGFDDFVMTTLSDDGKTHRLIISQSEVEKNERINHETFIENAHRDLNIADDPWFAGESIYGRETPSYHTVARMLEKYPDYFWANMMRETGLAATITTTLKHRGKIVGGFFIHYEKELENAENLFPLIQSIANQLSTTVANILANEEILEREREKELLLSLSEDMATIRDSNDLWRVMMEKLRPIVGFDDAVVIVFAPDQKTSKTIFTLSKGQRIKQQWYQNIKDNWIPVTAPLSYIYNLKTAYWSTEEILDQWADFDGCLFMRGEGLLHTYQISLKQGGSEIGLLLFHFREREAIQQSKYNLYKAIGDQVAVAVANILANEEILEREREKTVMLSINEAIAAIRSRDELLAFILEEVQPLLGFNQYAGVVILNEEDNKLYNFFTTVPPHELESQTIQPFLKGFAPEGEFGKILNSREPVVKDDAWIYQELSCEADRLAAKVWKELNFKQGASVSLRYGSRVIGSFHTHYFEPVSFTESRLRWFAGIADQLAVAVANILANEEIIEREREKSILLSISEVIAAIRDKDDLFEVITEKIKPIFNFDDAVVFVCNLEQNCYYLLLTNAKQNRLESHFYQPLAAQSLPLKESIEEWIVNHDKPFICSTAQFAQQLPDAPGVRLMEEVGIKDSMLGVMRNGGKIIGSFHLHSERENFFQSTQLAIFQSVTEQLAVAVSNILANEEILEREREKSQMLEITKAIARVQNVDELYQTIYELLQPIFAFDDAVIKVLLPNGNSFRHLSSTLFEAVTQQPDVAALLNSPIADSPNELTLGKVNPQTGIFDAEQLMALYEAKLPDRTGNEIIKQLNFKEWFFTPLYHSGKLVGSLEFFAIEHGRFDESQFKLFENAAQQIAASVANILANEEIAQLAEERRLRAEDLTKANEAMARTSARLVEQPDLMAFLGQVVIEAAHQLNADAAVLTIIDEEPGNLQIIVATEAGKLISTDDLAAEIPEEQAAFFAIFGDSRKPRFLSLERDADLFWASLLEYHQRRKHEGVLCVPLFAGDKPLGHLGLAFTDVSPISEHQTELVAALAHQAALAIQLTRLSDEARSKAEETAVLDERNRIAREIHDTLAQSFTGIIIQLEAGKRVLQDAPAATEAHLERASTIAREGLSEARRSVQALRPLNLEQTDLATVIEQFLDRMTGGTKVRYEFSLVGKPIVFPSEIETNFLRIGQEAVTNALRHGDATRIKVELSYVDDSINLVIADDGLGFNSNDVKEGFGLIGMRERARSVNARLEISSEEKGGTKITVVFPGDNQWLKIT